MAKFSENLDLLLKGIDQQLAALNSLRPLKSTDEERLWRKFRLEWNYNSNHIEGNTLTYGETQLLLLFDQTTPNHHFRELEEMKAHDVAVALVRQWAEEKTRELTEADIRSLNETILVRPYWKEAMTSGGQSTRRLIDVGEYKKHPNSVLLANGEMFHYTEPAEVPREMAALMEWYRAEGALLHPLVTSALFHYRFVRVHPFDDGNGRMARLLMNYHLMRHGLPPVIIPSIDKQNYLFALQRADVGDLEAFVVYIGEQLSRSLEWSIRAGRGESVEEEGDWKKEATVMSKRPQPSLEKITSQLIFDLYRNRFWPLFQALTDDLSIINNLFDRHSNRVFIRLDGRFLEFHEKEKMGEALERLLGEDDLKNITQLGCRFSWSGRKDNPQTENDLFIELLISFNTYQYEISHSYSDGSLLTHKYPGPIEETEQHQIIESIGKSLLTKIKEN